MADRREYMVGLAGRSLSEFGVFIMQFKKNVFGKSELAKCKLSLGSANMLVLALIFICNLHSVRNSALYVP